MNGDVETGVVRTWHDDEGWGVIDSPATPGGCWVHFSAVLVDGFRDLRSGAKVLFVPEAATQDGYSYRAVRAWPAERAPVEQHPGSDIVDGAMSSTLVLTFDEPQVPDTEGGLLLDGTVPAGAVTVRTGRPGDLSEVERLWAATFPALPVSGLTAALADGRSLVLTTLGDDSVLAAAAVLAPTGDGEGRTTLLADRPDRWLALESATAAHLRQQGILRWHVTVRQDAADSLQLLEAAGYELTSTSWGALLVADDVDVVALRHLVDVVATGGLAMRRLTADDADDAHRLISACRPDFPATPATPAPDPTLDQVHSDLGDADHAAYGCFDGGRLVGITTLTLASEMPTNADTDLTAVRSDHRGRGVATAVKAFAILDLLQHGVHEFRTGGAAVNEASLRANRRLGYDIEPTWLTWTGC